MTLENINYTTKSKDKSGGEKHPVTQQTRRDINAPREVAKNHIFIGGNRGSSENSFSLTPIEKRGPYWFKRDDLFQIHGVNGGKARSCWTYLQMEMKKGSIDGVITGGSRVSP